jgi:hypothetical protein
MQTYPPGPGYKSKKVKNKIGDNKKWKWICICCEKEVPIYIDGYPGNDEEGISPNLEGGTVEIHFGFGSKFDQIEDMMSRRDIRIQACVCDKCFTKKINLTRKIEVRKTRKYIQIGNAGNV